MIGKGTRAVAVLAVAVCLLAAAGAAAAPWDTWGTDAYTLDPGEAFTFRIAYDEIPVRSWKLVVDGDYVICDLHVLRLVDGSLLYFEKDESHHELILPWGAGEEISVVLTAGPSQGGVFTVKLMGPPRDHAPASYSYKVNRALESYASGHRVQAENYCDEALRDNPDDGVALVLKAGFLRDNRFYERAAGTIGRALRFELPDEMRMVALDLQDQLALLRRNLPEDLRDRLAALDDLLDRGEGQEALDDCTDLARLRFSIAPGQIDVARVEIMQRRGRALHILDRHFEAIDVFTAALTLAESRADQAVLYFRMGDLFADMENIQQATGAYRIARSYGLPAAMDAAAAEALAAFGKEGE